MFEVAPGMFFKNLEYIEKGILQSDGTFLIETISGCQYQVPVQDAERTVRMWRRLFPQKLTSQQQSLEWIARFRDTMAEIDRQLAELPGVIAAVQAEVSHEAN